MIKKCLLTTLFLIVPLLAKADGGLMIFGYLQPHYTMVSTDYYNDDPNEYNYGGLGQMNMFLQQYFGGGDFSAFVNFEITNNFNSEEKFGAFKLQEAYLRWEPNDNVNIKFGYFIPKFNGFFEIYNRTPLYPYVHRPRAYETNWGTLVNNFNILPQLGLLQADANIPLADNLYLDAAGFVNHPTNGFIASEDKNLIPGYITNGQSGVTYLGFGGRVGLRYNDIKIGFSATTDKENLRTFKADVARKYEKIILDEFPEEADQIINSYLSDPTDLGDVNRFRIGADFSAQYAGFTLMAEYSKVTYDFSAGAKEKIDNWLVEDWDYYYLPADFDKSFYFVTLQYDYKQFFVYGSYGNTEDDSDPWFFGIDGLNDISAGLGWNINDNISLKLQYINGKGEFWDVDDQDNEVRAPYNENWFAIGTSIALF